MMKKVFFVSLGCLSLALGVVGIVLPVRPHEKSYVGTSVRLSKYFLPS